MVCLSVIVAAAENGVIGRDNALPWQLPEDLRYFRRVTMGRPLVMGRRTFESIGRPLPGRTNIVISRNPDFEAIGADVSDSLEKAVEISETDEIMVIGGGQLYTLALPLARRMILTLIDLEPRADTFFPEWQEDRWNTTGDQYFPADDNNGHAYRIVELSRIATGIT